MNHLKISYFKKALASTLLHMKNYFSDYDNSKSFPVFTYEVKVPEELKIQTKE